MKKKNFWSCKRTFSEQVLKEDLHVDVLIIGGGMSGVSLLYALKDSPLQVCLAERNTIGSGVTSKTTAKISYLQGIVYSKILKSVSLLTAQKYLQSQKKAMEMILENIRKEHIECDLEEVTSYYMTEDQASLQREYEFLKSEGMPVALQDHVLEARQNYVFHPLKYLYALAYPCRFSIYEHTLMTHIFRQNDVYVCEGNAKIYAKNVVLACHYPFQFFPFFLPVRTWIEQSYILAQKCSFPKKETWLTSVSSKRYAKKDSFDYEILLNGSHSLWVKWNEVMQFQKLISEKKPDFVWTNEDIMTMDHMPFIGRIRDHLFLATGYNTWGMTNSACAAFVLKDLLLKKENLYASLFDPYRRSFWLKWQQYPISVMGNLLSFLKSKYPKRKVWYPDSISFSKKNGRVIAIYEENGVSYPVFLTCPHMGCSLIFNPLEKTWDCPCHASRFDITGNCIKGPSKYSIRCS